MVIVEGTPVSFHFLPTRRSYGAVDVADEVAANGLLCPSKLSKFNFYFIDPLTSMLRPSRCAFDREVIHDLDIVRQMPVERDFEIDSVDFFYDWTLCDYAALSRGKHCDDVARQFWDDFSVFLREHSSELLVHRKRESECLWKSDFTDLGLDFMRQHYRSIKANAIRKGGNSSLESLQQLLSQTKAHRTTDADWIPQSFHDGTYFL